MKKGINLIEQLQLLCEREEWKTIDSYNNYMVSTRGRIKNIDTKRILKQTINDGYCKVTLCTNGEQQKCAVHRLVGQAYILNIDNKPFIDHKNNVTTDNDVNNLRWVTNVENCQNRKISCKNKSGVKGVSWNKRANKWQACTKNKGKSIHMGYFSSIEEAKIARQIKIKQLFGEYVNECEL